MDKCEVRSFPPDEEYKKPTGITPADIGRLRDWLRTQPHLPEKHITDLDLILAFHGCKCSIETTKKLLDTHYTMKTNFTTIFKDRVVDDKIEWSLNRILLVPLPTRTKDGDAVLYAGMVDTDIKNFLFMESMRATLMVLELWQYEEGTWPGLIIVYDLSGLKFGHIFKVEMETVKQFLIFLQEAMFLNIKGIHLLNAPYFMDYFLALVKRFVRNELLEVFTIHQKASKTLEKHVDMEALPKEAGGSYKTFEQCKEETLLKMRASKQFFVTDNLKRVNECLRPEPAKVDLGAAKKLPKKQDNDNVN